MKKIEPQVRKHTRLVKPIIVDEVSSDTEKVIIRKTKEKAVYNSVPTGHVRVIVLKPFNGMFNELNPDDVVDLPERRFKTLLMRGLVKEYKGDRIPNKLR